MNALLCPESERAALGALLLDSARLQETVTFLRPEEFGLDSHRLIYSAMLDLTSAGNPVDTSTVCRSLGKRLPDVGGAAYVSELTDGVVASSAPHHIKVIQDAFRRRTLVNICNLGIACAEDASEDTETCYGRVHEALLKIETASNQIRAIGMKDIMAGVMAQLQRQAKQDGLLGATTGIDRLDQVTTGIRAGELWVIGALPSRGKTALGIQLLKENAKNGMPGVMFSLEMSSTQVGTRLLAAYSRVSAGKLRAPRWIGEEGWAHLFNCQAEMQEWPVFVDDASELRLSELIARARLYIRKFKAQLIVVDYLMLIDAPGKELRHQADAISKAMRSLAKTEQVSVILLSQFKRGQNINDRPNMGWFKESGGIEANAHVALALHREIGDEDKFNGNDSIIVVKNREGELGNVPVFYSPERLQFFDAALRDKQ